MPVALFPARRCLCPPSELVSTLLALTRPPVQPSHCLGRLPCGWSPCGQCRSFIAAAHPCLEGECHCFCAATCVRSPKRTLHTPPCAARRRQSCPASTPSRFRCADGRSKRHPRPTKRAETDWRARGDLLRGTRSRETTQTARKAAVLQTPGISIHTMQACAQPLSRAPLLAPRRAQRTGGVAARRSVQTPAAAHRQQPSGPPAAALQQDGAAPPPLLAAAAAAASSPAAAAEQPRPELLQVTAGVELPGQGAAVVAGVGDADYINRQLMEILAPKTDYLAVRGPLVACSRRAVNKGNTESAAWPGLAAAGSVCGRRRGGGRRPRCRDCQPRAARPSPVPSPPASRSGVSGDSAAAAPQRGLLRDAQHGAGGAAGVQRDSGRTGGGTPPPPPPGRPAPPAPLVGCNAAAGASGRHPPHTHTHTPTLLPAGIYAPAADRGAVLCHAAHGGWGGGRRRGAGGGEPAAWHDMEGQGVYGKCLLPAVCWLPTVCGALHASYLAYRANLCPSPSLCPSPPSCAAEQPHLHLF